MSCLYFSISRRELLWPELDQLLQNEDGATAVSTPYTAAVLEYRVVFHDPEDKERQYKSLGSANGHTVHDAQHPCRCQRKQCLENLILKFFFLLL